MIDLTPMGSVRVDPERRRAWVQGGALLGDLDRATQPLGLATTAGNVSHTGVGGLTLGGMGWLARRFGLACDNVTRFELVTADGELLSASETENPDLFWGLRGGGGNFGVVTGFEFELHHVGTAALLVDLFYDPDDGPAVLRRWADLIPEAPPQATLTAWVGTTGAWPFLPSALWNRPMASVEPFAAGMPGARSEPAIVTRALLACGVAASPLFVVAGLLQASTRDGFDLGRHQLSLLSLGDLGLDPDHQLRALGPAVPRRRARQDQESVNILFFVVAVFALGWVSVIAGWPMTVRYSNRRST